MTLPDGSIQTPALGVPLAPGASAQIGVPWAIPSGQAGGPAVARARLTWQDGAQGTYGPSVAEATTAIAALPTATATATWVPPTGSATSTAPPGSTATPTATSTPTPGLNQPPVVDAGPDQTITLPATTARLAGTVGDDGLPAGGALTSTWSQVSGPGTIAFADAGQPGTTATFSAAGAYTLRLTASDGALSSAADVRITVVNPTATNPGGVFITGHDPDFHAYQGSNSAGAQHLLQRGIAYVTGGKAAPKLLLVTDLRNPGAGYSDPRAGLSAAGFSYDLADYGSGTSGVKDLHTVRFADYDALVVASDYGGWLRQDELDILNARSNELIAYVNGGGGIVACSEGGNNGLTSSKPFGYLPFVVSNIAFGQTESGVTVTQAGTALGLTNGDVNGNASHSVFTATGGMDIIDQDPQGQILTLAARGGNISGGGVGNQPPVVHAGPNQTLAYPATSAQLAGAATDDGLPKGSTLAIAWSQVSGPGTATFAAVGQPATGVGFSAVGTYTLRLTASDGQYSSAADVRIAVQAQATATPTITSTPTVTATPTATATATPSRSPACWGCRPPPAPPASWRSPWRRGHPRWPATPWTTGPATTPPRYTPSRAAARPPPAPPWGRWTPRCWRTTTTSCGCGPPTAAAPTRSARRRSPWWARTSRGGWRSPSPT